MIPQRRALEDRDVHIWYVDPDEVDEPALARAFERLLAPEEAARGARFHRGEDRHLHLVTRALVRTVLSEYAAVAPRDWAFRAGAHGRPELDGDLRFGFSLTNTRGLVACAVARTLDVGLDAEQRHGDVDVDDLAARFFSPREVSALRATPAEDRLRRFFEYWTLKESYVKARGLGLTLPLDSFTFTLLPAVRIEFDDPRADDSSAWHFAQLFFSPRHAVALAVRRPPGVRVEVAAHPAGDLLRACAEGLRG
jgi:4'-phosphopantetheinyl transferase